MGGKLLFGKYHFRNRCVERSRFPTPCLQSLSPSNTPIPISEIETETGTDPKCPQELGKSADDIGNCWM